MISAIRTGLFAAAIALGAASAAARTPRPVVTVAVQGLSTTGALEPARETSNVAARIFGPLFRQYDR